MTGYDETSPKGVGISPVVATIIMIAIVIALAIAAMYWLTGLVGLFTGYEDVRITAIYETQDHIELVIKNFGTSPSMIDVLYADPKNIWGVWNCSGRWYPLNTEAEEPYLLNPGEKAIIIVMDLRVNAGQMIEFKIHTSGGYVSSKSIAVSKSYRPSWLVGWRYRRAITIEERSGTSLSNFQVEVILNRDNFDYSKAKDDGSDIRFTLEDGITLLPYWIEYWNNPEGYSVIWVKVPEIPASSETKIYMYYGNQHASYAGDGDAVFEFFDDFRDLDKWIVPSGYEEYYSITYVDDKWCLNVTYKSGSGGPRRFLISKFSTSGLNGLEGIRVRYNVRGYGEDVAEDMDDLVAVGNDDSYVSFKYNVYFGQRLGDYGQQHSVYVDGEYYEGNVEITSEWRIAQFWTSNGRVYGKYRGELIYKTLDAALPDSGYLKIYADPDPPPGGHRGILIDYIFVTKYTYPQPYTTVGPEESRG
ncbi:MAG: hypothetical protein DRJ32_02055 [Thermoprotei archaeon]|nr:MAG: hypothetical protein DRJ32_02055 [Thermoprotei archaeon]RLI91191.1 MAG: hypothetical protein DRO65_01665 [Candidatus Altiarchaeales archaeon]